MSVGALATDDTRDSSIRASLVLRNFGAEPQVITDLLGISPTRAARAGDSLRGLSGQSTSRKANRTYWSLHSRRESSALLSDHVTDIIDQLEGATHLFASLPTGTTLTLFCTVIPDDDLPILRLNSHELATLGTLGIDLELDILSVDGPIES